MHHWDIFKNSPADRGHAASAHQWQAVESLKTLPLMGGKNYALAQADWRVSENLKILPQIGGETCALAQVEGVIISSPLL